MFPSYCMVMDVTDLAVMPPVMSREFLKRAERVQSSPDPDTATAQTVQIMCRLIHESALDPLVKGCASDSVAQYRGGPLYAGLGLDPFQNPLAMAESCWWWAKHNLHFVHHTKLIYAWLNERDQLQLLISPDVLLRMPARGKKMVGDCAIYTMLVSAFLEALGIGWDLMTLAVNPAQPDVYSHVFPRAILPDGRRIPMDASHGKYPGWQVPAEHTFRLQAWDASGAPVQDTAQYSGLHDYVPARKANWFGLGDDLDSGGDYVSPDVTIPPITVATGSQLGYDPTGAPIVAPDLSSLSPGASYPAGSFTVPSQSDSTAWAAAIRDAAKAGLTLAELNAIPAGTVISPNGQIIRQAAGYPVGTSTSLTTSLTGTNVLMWGAVLLGGVFLVSQLRR